VESLRKFIPPDELWPPGPSWGYHWADLDVFRALNLQILGDENTGSLEEFVDATQINQGTIFQFGIEHMRRRKPKSSAISICHFITWAPDMKWGIVDYFQEPKLSFDFVRRAYQPVLPTMQFERRRWLPGETFTGRLWVVNDLHEEFPDCTLKTEIRDIDGEVLHEQSDRLGTVAVNSSAEYATIEWDVTDTSTGNFQVDLTLLGADGEEIASNDYVLLRGDQAAALKECEALSKKLRARRYAFPKSDYTRHYPQLSGPERAERFGDAPPLATDFGE
jgi:beta-mannosidase